MRLADLQIDAKRLAELCERRHVARLELFGSFVAGAATPESDLDILVTFEPGARVGLGIVALQQELEALFGRPVDLLTRDSVERSANKYFRRFALRRTEPLYECA
ncbi:MAG: nucleotidyltransferase domain-containing protein [Phycisphaeraceae bacterium]|nr:nucleotidyltransferase domain-containing protein [Phycisphaeraceae bacterium]